MSQTPYTGTIHHPDMTVNADLTFWFYPDEGAFYFDGDKGETTNIWKNAHCYSDKIGLSHPEILIYYNLLAEIYQICAYSQIFVPSKGYRTTEPNLTTNKPNRH